MTQRLLFVEQSATMRHVMVKHAESLGFSVDASESFSEAANLLTEQFQQYGTDYNAVLFGWPTTAQDDALSFSKQLESPDHKGLPVVVMSTDMRAETRAWVAARESSSLLSWKKYHELDDVLKTLIDTVPAATLVQAGPDSHQAVRLLVVDDSATIRQSLKNLFESQGYHVALAATHEEAMTAARQQACDIAVVDYYLSDTTGDVLCQDLIGSDDTGDIVCTILTGTYSDHIIKQSLNAGAVECMFKNESSRLLLARINAISRLTQSTRKTRTERNLLDKVLLNIAGAVLVVGFDQKLIYANALAVEQLGLSSASSLIGYPLQQLTGSDTPIENADQLQEATWFLPHGKQIDVDFHHSSLEPEDLSLLRFTPRVVSFESDNVTLLQHDNEPEGIVRQIVLQHDLRSDSKALLLQALRYLEQAAANVKASTPQSPESVSSHYSLLLLEVFLRDPQDQLQAVTSNPELSARVNTVLLGLLSRDNHVCALSDNRYAFLLQHKEQSQAYAITRKAMQQCLEISDIAAQDNKLACTGSLLSLTSNSTRSLDVLVQHAITGLEIVNNQGPDQAILLDVRRLLSAYPAS